MMIGWFESEQRDKITIIRHLKYIAFLDDRQVTI